MFGYTPELECILLHTWTHQTQTIHFCSKLLIFFKLNKANNICYPSFIYLEFKSQWWLWMEILFFIIKVLHAPWQPQLSRSAAFSALVLKPQLKIPSVLTRGWREEISSRLETATSAAVIKGVRSQCRRPRRAEARGLWALPGLHQGHPPARQRSSWRHGAQASVSRAAEAVPCPTCVISTPYSRRRLLFECRAAGSSANPGARQGNKKAAVRCPCTRFLFIPFTYPDLCCPI